MIDSFDSPSLTLRWIGDIVLAEYKQDVVIDLELAKWSVETRINFTQKEDAGLVFDLRNVKHIEIDARKFLGTEVATECMKAGALIINSPVQKVLANFFLRFSQPKVPARLFTNREEAIEWVNEILEEIKTKEGKAFSILL